VSARVLPVRKLSTHLRKALLPLGAVTISAGLLLVAAPASAAPAPPPPAPAGAGEWDYMGWSAVEHHKGNEFRTIGVIDSGGGNFKVCLKEIPNTPAVLWEYDPGANGNDDAVSYLDLDINECDVKSVESFVDGSDGEAELYVVVKDSEAVIEFWD